MLILLKKLSDWFKEKKLWLRAQFFTESGPKEVYHLTGWGRIIVYSLFIIILGWVIWGNFRRARTSFDVKTEKSLFTDDELKAFHSGVTKVLEALPIVGERMRTAKKEEQKIPSAVPISALSAKQVIERDEGVSARGAKDLMAIGQLTTRFDSTQEGSQKMRVILPYGLKGDSADAIAPMTVVEGMATTSGKDNRVFIQFDRAFLPNGDVLNIVAEALSSGDYNSGVKGEFHSDGDMKVASGLTMAMISGVTAGLADKVALAEGAIGVAGGIKNALLQGVSETSKIEAERQMNNVSDKEGYVTLESGADLIVSFIKISESTSNERQ